MQGFGILVAGIVNIILAAALNHYFPAPAYSVDPIGSTVPQADYLWRIVLMFGAVPAVLTYYSRAKMPETARYTALVAKDAKKAAADMPKVLNVEITDTEETAVQGGASYGLFSREFVSRHALHLVGTAVCWFLPDIAYCSQNLFQKHIFSAVGWIPKANTMNAVEEVYKIARAQTLIALCGTVPGFSDGSDSACRIWDDDGVQARASGAVPPVDYPGKHIRFVVMYALTFFCANFGLNSTTFIVPAEIFPARLRSTCHGISAAAGKAGAIVGAFGFLYAAQNPAGIGVRNSLFVLAACNLVGMCFTFLLPESRGKSLEEMSGENEDEHQRSTLEVPPV